MLVCPEVVRVLYQPLSVSPRLHHDVATVLRCRPVGPAGSALLSEVTIVHIDNVDAAMVRLLLHHLLILFASNEFTLPVCGVRPRIWILLIILILLEEHHTFLPTGDHDLLVI